MHGYGRFWRGCATKIGIFSKIERWYTGKKENSNGKIQGGKSGAWIPIDPRES